MQFCRQRDTYLLKPTFLGFFSAASNALGARADLLLLISYPGANWLQPDVSGCISHTAGTFRGMG